MRTVYIHYADCDDGFMGLYIYVKSHKIVQFKYVHLIYSYTSIK